MHATRQQECKGSRNARAGAYLVVFLLARVVGHAASLQLRHKLSALLVSTLRLLILFMHFCLELAAWCMSIQPSARGCPFCDVVETSYR